MKSISNNNNNNNDDENSQHRKAQILTILFEHSNI